MITSWKDIRESIIMSKFNSVEISTQSSQKCKRKNILNFKIIKKCYSFWGFKAETEHWPIFAHFALKLHCTILTKSWNFFLNYQILDLLVVKQYRIH